MSNDDLSSIESSLDDMFRRLGLPAPDLLSRLTGDWDGLAGEPWSGRSAPVVVQDRTLVVEAFSPSMVAFLRYGVADLLRRLTGVLGPDVVSRIEVRPPARR